MTPSRTEAPFLERHQTLFYLASIAGGAALGLLVPPVSAFLAASIAPLLAVVLYATFLGIPFARIGQGLRELRFLLAVLVLNFAVVPLVVFGLSRFVQNDRALLTGVLLVLLAPCVDYVVVFTRIAGGAAERLLAATPLLMLAQIVLLPGYLFVFAEADTMRIIQPSPLIAEFLVIVILPLALAWGTQRLAGPQPASEATMPSSGDRAAIGGSPLRRSAGMAMALAQTWMVPLMMATLAAVVGSQIFEVARHGSSLAAVAPIYAAFLLVMLPLGMLVAKVAGLDVRGGRALVFSGATRNSLVVLPAALALPDTLSATPLVVVTQTLVELLGLIVYVRTVPRILRITQPRT